LITLEEREKILLKKYKRREDLDNLGPLLILFSGFLGLLLAFKLPLIAFGNLDDIIVFVILWVVSFLVYLIIFISIFCIPLMSKLIKMDIEMNELINTIPSEKIPLEHFHLIDDEENGLQKVKVNYRLENGLSKEEVLLVKLEMESIEGEPVLIRKKVTKNLAVLRSELPNSLLVFE